VRVVRCETACGSLVLAWKITVIAAMMTIMAIGGAVTSVMIYSADLEKLKSKQRQAAAEHDRNVRIVDVIHALIEAAEAKTETGE
jgi:hypothetical protein